MRIIKSVLLLMAMSQGVFAAVGSGTVWWVQTTAPAGNTSGGAFDTTAILDTTLGCAVATSSAPTCGTTNYAFVAGDVGYWVYIQTGTNFTPGWYQIASVIASSAVLNAPIGSPLQFDTTKGSPYTHYQASTVLGVATTASPTGGTWGIDYSKSDTRIINAVADLTIDAASNVKCTSVSRTCGFNDIGNMIHVQAGTGWTVGYFEVSSCTAGAFNLDRTPSAAGNANKGTWYYGGASSFGSAVAGRLDSAISAGTAPGNRMFIKAGTYTMGTGTTFTAGTAVLPTIVEGYSITPGDAPTGTSRPLLSYGTVVITGGVQNEFYNLSITGTAATLFVGGTASKIVNTKIVNTSTTAGRTALSTLVNGTMVVNNELISYRGIGLSHGGGSTYAYGNYIHNSDKGISSSAGAILEIFLFNIIADNVTFGYFASAAITSSYLFAQNTFYGAENKLGVAFSAPTATTSPRVLGNIFYGYATGISLADTSQAGYSDYNDFYNITSTFTANTWQSGMHDVAVDPGFISMGQYTGTGGSTSGSVLTDGSANFANTTDNVDFVYISSGGISAATTGQYLITSHSATTLTVDIAPGNSASGVSYQTTWGHNFSPGNNVRAISFPGSFGAGLSRGYLDLGPVQRAECPARGFAAADF